jgi:hypothetical protein
MARHPLLELPRLEFGLLEILLRHHGASLRTVNMRQRGSGMHPDLKGAVRFVPRWSFFGPDMNKQVNQS